MSAELERRYRAALDWYPKVWRDQNGEAMLGTLLDEADSTGRDKPALGQTVNLVFFALRERANAALPAAVRNRAAALAWGLGATLSALTFVGSEWAPWSTGEESGLLWGGEFGPFASAAVVLYALWIVGFVVAIAGAGGVARWILAATIPTSVALVVFDSQPWAALRPSMSALVLLATLALISIQGSPPRSARARLWAVISAIGASGFVLPIVFGARRFYAATEGWLPRDIWTELTRPLPYLAVLGAVALVAVVARRFAWAGAALLLSAPFAVFALAILTASGGAIMLLVCGVAIVVVVALAHRSGYRVVLQRRE